MALPLNYWKIKFGILVIILSQNIYGSDLERPRYEKAKIQIQKKIISVELAVSPKEHQYGLMNVKFLPENHGMLFVFSNEEIRHFWMKNTLIPLSIAYINSNKEIIDIQEMTPTSPMEQTLKTYPSKLPAMFALEMNKGWFEKNKIKVGTKIKIN